MFWDVILGVFVVASLLGNLVTVLATVRFYQDLRADPVLAVEPLVGNQLRGSAIAFNKSGKAVRVPSDGSGEELVEPVFWLLRDRTAKELGEIARAAVYNLNLRSEADWHAQQELETVRVLAAPPPLNVQRPH